MQLNGYVAQWQGGTYEANAAVEDGRLLVRLYCSSQADGFTEVSTDRFVRTIPTAELERLVYVLATCRWRGAPFCVLAREASGKVLLEYAGGSSPAKELGLAEVEHRVYRAWVPADDVGRIEAVEIPLL